MRTVNLVYSDQNDYYFILKTSKKQGYPNTMHCLVLLDKATKSKLQFNLRCQANPKELQQLDWITPEFQHCKGENELRFVATKVVNKLIDTNLECLKGRFIWKIPQTVKKEASITTEPSKKDEKIVEKKIEEIKKEVDKELSKEKNFFDDEEFEDPIDLKKKPVVPSGANNQSSEEKTFSAKENIQNQSLGDQKHDSFGDFGNYDESSKRDRKSKVPVASRQLSPIEKVLMLTKIMIRLRKKILKKWKKPSPLIHFTEFFTPEDSNLKIFWNATLRGEDELLVEATDITNNKPFKPIIVKKAEFKSENVGFDIDSRALSWEIGEEAAHEDHNKSVLSNKSSSSIVSRRCCIFEEKSYTISAHKYVDSNKVILRVMPTGSKEVKDEIEIKHPDAEDEEQLVKLARDDLKICSLEGDTTKGVKIINPLRLDGVDFSDPNQLVNIFASFIKNRPQPVYREHIKEDYYWFLIPEDENKLKIHLVKNSDMLEADFVDFNCTNEDANQVRTEEEYKQVVDRYWVNWSAESPHIEEKSVMRKGSHHIEEAGDALEEGEEEDDDFQFGSNKPKYEIVVQRTTDDRNIIEVISVKIKDQEEADKVELKCLYKEDGEIGENERNLDHIKKAWEADPKSGKLREKKTDVEEDGDGKSFLP
jgi:hypothetical protein